MRKLWARSMPHWYEILGISALLVSAGGGVAQTNPTLRISNETLADRLVQNAGGCDTAQSGSYTLQATLPLTDADVKGFDENTELTLEFDSGNVVDFALGDDPHYRPGRRSVLVKLITTNDNGDDVTYGTASLKWDSRKATLTVNARPISADDALLAESYIGGDPGPVDDTDSASLSLDTASAEFDVQIAGSVTARDVDCGDDTFTLTSVRLHAVGTPAAE